MSLRAIAEQTKIKQSLLDELERGDVSHWPGGIFRRAFIRAYAQAIGLEPDAIVREFLDLYPDPGEDVATIARAALGDVPVGPIARLRAAVGATFRGDDAHRNRREAPQESQARRSEAAAVSVAAEPRPAMLVEPQPDIIEEPRPLAIEEPQPLLIAEPEMPAEEPPSPIVEPDVVAETSAAIEEEEFDPAAIEPSLETIAQLCTALGRVEHAEALNELLDHVVRVFDAAGLILWMWDPGVGLLKAVLAHGYPPSVLAHLPAVNVNDDNATAAACRLAQTCVVNGSDRANGALAVPLIAPLGCGGVLAIELRNGKERSWRVRAAAEIVAAQLAAMMCVSLPAAERKLA